MIRYAVRVSDVDDQGLVTARVVGLFGDVGSLADRVRLSDAESRLDAAKTLARSSGAPIGFIHEELSSAYVRSLVRSEMQLAGIDRRWAS